jgi:glycosyltransferase involved in cell wall biosynthesis
MLQVNNSKNIYFNPQLTASPPVDIVFWMNIPSIHMAPLAKSLADDFGKRVLVVVFKELTQHEAQRGWSTFDYGRAELLVLTSSEERLALLEATRSAPMHFFGGLGAYPELSEVMQKLTAGVHGKIGVFSESIDPRGVSGFLRKMRFRFLRKQLLKSVDTLFVTGTLARLQFQRLGCPDSKMALFGYFAEEALLRPDAKTPLKVIYVGSFISLKNTLLIARSLNFLSGKIELTVVGTGPVLPKFLQHIASFPAMLARFNYIPTVPNNKIQALIAENDVLVLPSKYDGWGVTVNEALLVGTKVLVTKAAGSEVLVHGPLQGNIIDASDPKKLALMLDQMTESLDTIREQRAELKSWAIKNISPKIAANYFLEQMSRSPDNSTSPPPWIASFNN